MSVATELTRIQGAKADLKTAIEAKGVTVPSATLISGYSALVDQIQTGGIPDSDGLYDVQVALISAALTPPDTTFTIRFAPKYLLRYNSRGYYSFTGTTGMTIPATTVTFPTPISWSCDNQQITISGDQVTVPVGFDDDVTFSVTWVDYTGTTRTSSRVCHISNLAPAYSMINITGDTAVPSGKYMVTTTDPYNLGMQYDNIEEYYSGSTRYYICNHSAIKQSWMDYYTVLSGDGSTAALFNSSSDAKSAIDSL